MLHYLLTILKGVSREQYKFIFFGFHGLYKKRKKKVKSVVLGSGPRARSRAFRIVLPPPVKQVNDAVEVEVNKEVNDVTPKVSTAERLKLMRTNTPCSMDAYLKLRKREKMQAALKTMQSQFPTENLQQPVDGYATRPT
ncbi:hypothetical protein ACET3Z_024801 [Daucus carota]